MRWASCVLLAATSGCSYLAITPAPANHASLPYFDCTSSQLAPGVDLALGGIFALSTAAVIASPRDFQGDATAAGLIYGALAVASAAGAYHGFHRTAECRAAREQLIVRLRQQGPAWPPPAVWPPPQGPAGAVAAMLVPAGADPWLAPGPPPAAASPPASPAPEPKP